MSQRANANERNEFFTQVISLEKLVIYMHDDDDGDDELADGHCL